MTTILGVQLVNEAWLWSDSRIVAGDRGFWSHSVPKVVERGPYLIGAAGAAGACDYVQHVWQPPSPVVGGYADMVGLFVPSLRAGLTEAGLISAEKELDMQLLVALDGHLYQVETDLSVLVHDEGVYGIGSGAAYAIGAYQIGADMEDAMAVAADNDINTGHPMKKFMQARGGYGA